MVQTTDTLDGRLRKRGRDKYNKRVNEAWKIFCTAVQVDPRSSTAEYSEALHKKGLDMIDLLKIQNRVKAEQLEVDMFLKRFEELDAQMQELTDGN